MNKQQPFSLQLRMAKPALNLLHPARKVEYGSPIEETQSSLGIIMLLSGASTHLKMRQSTNVLM